VDEGFTGVRVGKGGVDESFVRKEEVDEVFAGVGVGKEEVNEDFARVDFGEGGVDEVVAAVFVEVWLEALKDKEEEESISILSSIGL
jgi:hypothetical protein